LITWNKAAMDPNGLVILSGYHYFKGKDHYKFFAQYDPGQKSAINLTMDKRFTIDDFSHSDYMQGALNGDLCL